MVYTKIIQYFKITDVDYINIISVFSSSLVNLVF